MKNDDEMYKSILSRRNEYRERKKKRIRSIKRTAPVLACFFLAIMLGLGYRSSFSELLKSPIQSDIIEEPQIAATDSAEPTDETPESAAPSTTDNKSAEQTKSNSDAVSTTVTVSGTETKQTTSVQQHQSHTVTTRAHVSETTGNTQAFVTTAPITQTNRGTDIQTTSPVITTAAVLTSRPAEQKPIITEIPGPLDVNAPEPIDTPNFTPDVSVTQPIPFDDIAAVANAVRSNDVSSYPERDQKAYLKMFERIRNDNFVYMASGNKLISLRKDLSIYLFPYATYEDIGLGYYVTYKGKLYHVMFYYADPYVINKTDGIAEYLKKRMGRRSDRKIKIQDQTVSEYITNDSMIYASSFIDSNHYYDIVTSAPEDEVIEFLNIFSYEQIWL